MEARKRTCNKDQLNPVHASATVFFFLPFFFFSKERKDINLQPRLVDYQFFFQNFFWRPATFTIFGRDLYKQKGLDEGNRTIERISSRQNANQLFGGVTESGWWLRAKSSHPELTNFD